MSACQRAGAIVCCGRTSPMLRVLAFKCANTTPSRKQHRRSARPLRSQNEAPHHGSHLPGRYGPAVLGVERAGGPDCMRRPSIAVRGERSALWPVRHTYTRLRGLPLSVVGLPQVSYRPHQPSATCAATVAGRVRGHVSPSPTRNCRLTMVRRAASLRLPDGMPTRQTSTVSTRCTTRPVATDKCCWRQVLLATSAVPRPAHLSAAPCTLCSGRHGDFRTHPS